MSYLFRIMFEFILEIAHYISDSEREKRGLPSRYRRYMGSVSRNSSRELDSLFQQQMEAENAKNAEAERLRQQREKYVFEDQDADMDPIRAEGVIPPKEDNGGDMMDSI
ncbi:MAG: hypothetical protein IJ071_12865 [Ruminococcus sp.]|nr:hypothetical protein [Ruminococcus sp.]